MSHKHPNLDPVPSNWMRFCNLQRLLHGVPSWSRSPSAPYPWRKAQTCTMQTTLTQHQDKHANVGAILSVCHCVPSQCGDVPSVSSKQEVDHRLYLKEYRSLKFVAHWATDQVTQTNYTKMMRCKIYRVKCCTLLSACNNILKCLNWNKKNKLKRSKCLGSINIALGKLDGWI